MGWDEVRLEKEQMLNFVGYAHKVGKKPKRGETQSSGSASER
jgi:hypothetical protein